MPQRAVFAFLYFVGVSASLPIAEVKAIAGGMVEGFLGDSAVKQCIQDSNVTFKDFEQAIRDFEQEDATDVLNGFRLLGSAFMEFPDALRECEASEGDVQKLVDALKQFHSPMQFAYHAGKDLLLNHHEIIAEISRAVSDYRSQQFADFGFQIGEALHKLILGVADNFEEFVKMHNKSYFTEAEREHRMAVFANNHEHILKIQQAEEGTAVYSYLSPFSDLTAEEFSARNGFKFSPNDVSLASAPIAEILDAAGTPDSFDWRSKGAVNPIKNQAHCGSCWAFATVANIEGAGFVETGKLVSLSEQELVDCDKKTGDEGCQGGLPTNAYKDMIENSIGLEAESNYPYMASDGTCKMSGSKEVAFISSWQKISTDEDQIAAALVKYGPLSIGINAGPMQWYMRGIANPWSFLCNPKLLDHGVAIVGYGAEDAKNYWIIRNSWGTSWGEKGYYRIIRGVGKCGLNTMVATATGIKIPLPPLGVVV